MDADDGIETADKRYERLLQFQNVVNKCIVAEEEIDGQTLLDACNTVENIVSEANVLAKGYEKVDLCAAELVLDSEILRRSHDIVGKVIQLNSNFTEKRFCNAINNLVSEGETEDWDKLCDLVCPYGTPLYTNASILPFIDVKPKEQIQKKRAQRKSKALAEEKCPKIAYKLDRKDDGSAELSDVYKQIKQLYIDNNSQPIPFFKLIINPQDFIDTAHHALQLSLLVRENKISMETGPDGLPHVRVGIIERQTSGAKPNQYICNLDPKMCEKYAEIYGLKESLLKRLKENPSSSS